MRVYGSVRAWRVAGAWLVLGTVAAPMTAGKAPPIPDWPAMRQATFTDVWRTVDESYFDPKFGGVDWAAVRVRYQSVLDRAADKEQLRVLLQRMLNELHRTHFAILPKEAAVYRPSQRTRIGTVGLRLAWIDGQVVITRAEAGSPAAKAGVQRGDAVLAVDGSRLAAIQAALVRAGMTRARQGLYLCEFTISRLHEPVGGEVRLQVSELDGEERTFELTCAAYTGAWSEPMGAFPSEPIECETRRGPDGVAYLRFNIFSPQLMKTIRGFLTGLGRAASDGDPPARGLVIDLRGNTGGLSIMGSGIAGWLCARPVALGHMRLRDGFMNFDVFPQRGAFTGPLAILIDCRTASTSELLAAGLQEAGRARIFGETSAGAALPSAFKILPTGDVLQYAIADLETPRGAMLEGRGVTPDVHVVRTRKDVAAGRDPVLAAAEAWLRRQASRPPAKLSRSPKMATHGG